MLIQQAATSIKTFLLHPPSSPIQGFLHQRVFVDLFALNNLIYLSVFNCGISSVRNCANCSEIRNSTANSFVVQGLGWETMREREREREREKDFTNFYKLIFYYKFKLLNFWKWYRQFKINLNLKKTACLYPHKSYANKYTSSLPIFLSLFLYHLFFSFPCNQWVGQNKLEKEKGRLIYLESMHG